jgi:CrcB protein
MQINSKTIRLTFLGGAFGTLIRFALLFLFGEFFAIVLVNVLGSALMGWLNGNKKYDSLEQNALWKTGFAGGFTTMSGFATLTVLYAQWSLAIALVGTLLITAIGLGAYWLSFKQARKNSSAKND